MASKDNGKVRDRCFACGRVLGKSPMLVDTRDDQKVYVGRECAKYVLAAGDAGYQPPKGGPRLFPLRSDHMQLWHITRNGQAAGTLRAKTREQAIQEYAVWAHCDPSELDAT